MSITQTDPRPIPTDARLVWMASERAAPLFRTLDRARAFDPLIVLLSVMPAVVVMFAASCSSWDAALSLVALDATGVPLPMEAQPAVGNLVPNGSVQPAALWLSAAMLRIVGVSWPMGIMAASLLGGLALMAMIWLFAKGFADRRLAFWAVLLAAFHPTLMSLLICPVPVSAALACSVAALWGHVRLGERGRWTPLKLLAVTASVTAALLLAGPIATVVAIVIVIDAVLSWMFKPGAINQARLPRTARAPGQLLFLRLVTVGIGVAVWLAVEGLIPTHHLVTAPSTEAVTEELAGPLNEPDMLIGPLWGIVAIGVGRLFRLSQRRGGNRVGRSSPRLLLTWLAVSVAVLFWFSRSSEAQFEPAARFVLANASVPMLITAAFAIEEAARRAVSGAWMLLAILMPLSMRLGDLMAMVSIGSPAMLAVGAAAAVAACWLAVLVLRAIVPLPAQRRGMLMLAVLLAIGMDAADGIRLVFREEWRQGDTDRLMAQLREERPRDAVVLLTDSPPPVKLVFALRGVNADVPMEIAPTWDEAVNRLNDRQPGGDRDRVLAAAWGLGDAIGAASPEALRPTGEPMLFEGRALLLYVTDPVGREGPSP